MRPVFPFSALTYRALVSEDQIVDIGLSLHGLHSSPFPYPPFYVPPPEKCLSFIFSQGSFFSVSKSMSDCPVFGHFFLSGCRPVSVRFLSSFA